MNNKLVFYFEGNIWVVNNGLIYYKDRNKYKLVEWSTIDD